MQGKSREISEKMGPGTGQKEKWLMWVCSAACMTLLTMVVCNSMLVIPCVYNVHLAGVFGRRSYMLTCMVCRGKDTGKQSSNGECVPRLKGWVLWKRRYVLKM